MQVTWTTFNKTDSTVEYGLMGGRLFEMSAKGNSTLFVDSGDEKREMYIHRVILTDLKPTATYGQWISDGLASYFSVRTSKLLTDCTNLLPVLVYHCGSDDGWSDVFYFTALNDSVHFSPKFALYGDLGNENPQSLARLQKDTQLGMYDAILHIGRLHTRTCSNTAI